MDATTGGNAQQDVASMASVWENKSETMYKQNFGSNELEERKSKALKECKHAVEHGGGPAGKLKLSMVLGKIKKQVNEPLLRRHHAVGCVGYAVISDDRRLPKNDFFAPGRKFRIRFRHSNVNCSDDADPCVREAAIKFCDQNVDGPLDLVLFTGRTSLARNSETLSHLLKLHRPHELEKLCHSDPFFYFSLVDSLRRGPSSFADLVYHSQFAYQLNCTDGQQRAVRFRLTPWQRDAGWVESGLLGAGDQLRPWECSRRTNDTRTADYLRRELINRLQQEEPVSYQLQIQVNNSVTDPLVWNPQQMWSERECPWLNLALIQLTTFIPRLALQRTYFNIVEKPTCLVFPAASCAVDPRSLQQAWSTIYTEFEERNHITQLVNDDQETIARSSYELRRQHIVTLCTAPVKSGGTVPSVDVYITFAGTHCRTTPQQLTNRIELSDVSWLEEFETTHSPWIEHFQVETSEEVGELLAVIVSVRHRSLTENWYLEQVFVSPDPNPDNQPVLCFPCHNIVQSRITLLSGEAHLAEKVEFELHRQEREFELCERRHQYQWATGSSRDQQRPARIKSTNIKELPEMDKLRASKYNGLRWDIDPVMIEFFRYILFDFMASNTSQSKGSERQAPAAGRQAERRVTLQTTRQPQSTWEATGSSFGAMTAETRRRTMLRHFSIQTSPIEVSELEEPATPPPPAAAAAAAAARRPRTGRDYWNVLKNTVSFAGAVSKSNVQLHVPEGAKGDMCRAVQRDVEFGQWFLSGPNPTMLRRCTEIPDKMPVTDQMIRGLLARTGRLVDEAKHGWVYIADYYLLDDLPTVHRDADHRYIAAPIVLLYVRPNGLLFPIAIQLKQRPGPDNPVWTPNEPRAENWMLAKLWVQHADFEYSFTISHLFRCHWLMEPFAIATMRQLASSHPVYKLLKPYFRYLLVSNTLIRNNLLQKSGHVARFHSIGLEGFNALTSRYWNSPELRFTDLDPVNDLKQRGVDDAGKLPRYTYRDQAVKLWTAIRHCVAQILARFYNRTDDVTGDSELQSWLLELREVGFCGLNAASTDLVVTSLDELTDLVARLIFTLTGQHSATQFDALDLYGFIPDVPAMMRRPPPTNKDYVVTRDELSATLPDQFPDAYFVALAFVIQVHKPDENVLGSSTEVYFVEPEVKLILDEFRRQLCQLTSTAKRLALGDQYENLMPSLIPVSAEPVPYIPREAVKEALLHGPKLSREVFMGTMAKHTMAVIPNIDLFTLPVCLHFAITLGGRSFIGRRQVAEMKTYNYTAVSTSRPPYRRTQSVSDPVSRRSSSHDVTDGRRSQRLVSSNF